MFRFTQIQFQLIAFVASLIKESHGFIGDPFQSENAIVLFGAELSPGIGLAIGLFSKDLILECKYRFIR